VSEFDELVDLLYHREDRIIEILIGYAKANDYVKYTSTLEEAWRASIKGINQSVKYAVANVQGIPEHHPDKDYANDPLSSFGVMEAGLHRSRGTTLSMFLGLMKYYRRAYTDCIVECIPTAKAERFRLYIDRVFEHIEMGFIEEWTNKEEPLLLDELRTKNRSMTNEKNRYLTIFESIPEPVAIMDEEGAVTTVNHSYSLAFQDVEAPEDRYYGEPAKVKLPAPILQKIEECFKDPELQGHFDVELESSGGTRRYTVQTTKMLDISEKFRGMIVIFNDVTDRERMMQELVLANEKIRLLGEMTRHDVMNFLTVIDGNLQLLGMKASDPTLSKYIRTSTEAARDIQRLLEASRDYQRIGSQQATWMNLSDTVRKGISNIGDKGKTVVIKLDAGVEVYADPHLERVFTNLAFNTLKHAPSANVITVHCEKSLSGGLTIWYEDDGPGIPVDKRSMLFNEKLGGRTGHGLHFVRRLLQITGMDIQELGEEGKGVRFTITVPQSGHRVSRS